MLTLTKTAQTATPVNLQAIAESIVGPIDWQDSFSGYVEKCPGGHLHTGPTKERDCQILLDNAPTIYCFHTSCLGVIEEKNQKLRSSIGKAERGGCIQSEWRPCAEDIARRSEKERAEKLKERAKVSLNTILARLQVADADLWELSPVKLDGDIKNEWRQLLKLYKPDDVVWIGDVYSSGKPEHQSNFRRVTEWMKESKCPGSYTCPATFKNSVYSRSNENVLARPYLVVESDPKPEKGTGLNKGQMLSVFAWCQQFMRLRAVVDTAGKSLHGWFDYPPEASLAELKAILPAIGCDPALFKRAQPCRLPGAWRSEKSSFQHLRYLDIE